MKPTHEVKISVLEERVMNLMTENSKEHQEIMDKIDKVCQKLEVAYVTKSEFHPVQKLVYGIVGLIVTTVFVAILKLIIK